VSYPLPGYRFAVSLDPVDAYVAAVGPSPPVVAAGAFSDVSGLSGELEVLAHPEGGRNTFVHQLPVRYSWGRLTLKKGVLRNRSLWDWFSAGLSGSLGARRDGSILLYDPDNRLAVTWEFQAGLAAKWVGPDLAAAQSATAIESLEIVHQGLVQIIDRGATA
jgi:phage tail-like protein